MEFNTVGGIGFFCGSCVKISQREFAGAVFVKDPQRLAGNGVILPGDAVTIMEDEDRGRCRIFRGKRRARRNRAAIGKVTVALFVAQVSYFVRESLYIRR